MLRISRQIDLLFRLLKWPAALLALLALPGGLLACGKLLLAILYLPGPLLPFCLGAAGYLALWWLVLRRRVMGSFFSTLEHELTHALFALATFHPVIGIRSTWSRGGHIRYRGEGNWLITISPYFFPTVSLLVLAAGLLLSGGARTTADVLLGASVAYHITSTMHETHPGQTDLQKVGLLFCLTFLPAANLISFGVIIAFCHHGLPSVVQFMRDLFWLG